VCTVREGQAIFEATSSEYEVSTWMQAEKAKVQERAGRRWEKKFKVWQQQTLASLGPRAAANAGATARKAGALPEGSSREKLTTSASLPLIRQNVSTEDAGFLEQEASKRAAEQRNKKEAKEAECQKLKEMEIQKLRDDMEVSKINTTRRSRLWTRCRRSCGSSSKKSAQRVGNA
jgi:hypothetical protein